MSGGGARICSAHVDHLLLLWFQIKWCHSYLKVLREREREQNLNLANELLVKGVFKAMEIIEACHFL